jgi:hypothetical protein
MSDQGQFHLVKRAVPHMPPGGSIIGSKVERFGQQAPLGRAGQPAEPAPDHVLPASDDGSYVSGARVAATGGTPIL